MIQSSPKAEVVSSNLAGRAIARLNTLSNCAGCSSAERAALRTRAPVQRPNWLTRHAVRECRDGPLPCHKHTEQPACERHPRAHEARAAETYSADAARAIAFATSARLGFPSGKEPRARSEASGLIGSPNGSLL